MHGQHRLLAFAVTSCALWLGGCASSEGARLADKGDYAGLRRYLEAQGRKLDGGDARDIARAVVRHEIRDASNPEDAKARNDDVAMCTSKVEGTLQDRADKRDDVGAKAAYVLVDDGLVSASRWRKEAGNADAAWRAVGARSLTGRGEGRRRELFLDLDTRVRTGAFAAALDALDPDDAEELVEAVRVDPETGIRGMAARAAGSLGGEAIVNALRDRWEQNEDGVRSSIVMGWAKDASYKAGGRDRLLWVTETTRGVPAITAASLLLSRGGAEGASGRAAVARAIAEGPTGQRLVAIAMASPADPILLEQIVKASESEDLQVRASALGKMALVKEHKQKALDALGELAARGGADANHAKHVLADLGDRRVVRLLIEDTKSKEPGVRAWAAKELAGMKEFPDASLVMTDEDVQTRVRAACGILAMKK